MPDWLRYIASYPDLILAFGADAPAGQRHYQQYGQAEGRSLTAFDPLIYGASHPDLAKAFGADPTALARHYITFGYSEGRATATFDPIEYAASNPDLVRAFGADTAALTQHYFTYGVREGRGTASFDPIAYGAANPDLIRAFGVDPQAFTAHYISYGVAEGRATSGFDPVRYLMSHQDLLAAGLNAVQARQHFLDYGAYEGRSADAGGDQASHAAPVGKVTAAMSSGTSDVDWFSFTLNSNEQTLINVVRDAPVGNAVLGARIDILDASGQRIKSGSITGDSFDQWLSFGIGAVQSGGTATYYIAVSGVSAGAYSLAVSEVKPGSYSMIGPVPPQTARYGGTDDADVFSYGSTVGTNTSYLTGGAGNDLLSGSYIVAGPEYFYGGLGADLMDGRGLRDTVDYSASPAAVTVSLQNGVVNSGGHADGDRLFSIEEVIGSVFGDRITGSGGNDSLMSGPGADLVDGGDGDDTLEGGAGMDTLIGGAGIDFLDYSRSTAGAIRVDLRSGLASGGDAEGDVISGFEVILGGGGADVLANAGAPGGLVSGYGGNDVVIDRSTGTDRVRVTGGSGNDLLIGASLVDVDGADTFVAFRETLTNEFGVGSDSSRPGDDTVIIDTFAHAAGQPFKMNLAISAYGLTTKLDLSDLRDEGGAILDFADIQRHMQLGTIELTGFRTAGGDAVSGSIVLTTGSSNLNQVPFDTAKLTADQFIFANGLNWEALVPAGFPIL